MERTTIGRILVGDDWRPAYLANCIAYVSPSASSPWRVATTGERATWQTRRNQHTVGRVWDALCYYSN